MPEAVGRDLDADVTRCCGDESLPPAVAERGAQLVSEQGTKRAGRRRPQQMDGDASTASNLGHKARELGRLTLARWVQRFLGAPRGVAEC